MCIVSARSVLLGICALLAVLLVEGCSSSSPRFASHDRKPPPPEAKPKPGPRFSSKEAEEEKKEDDKKVDPKESVRITTGERDFKKELNPAITPLDQSKMMREISKYMGVPYVHGGASFDGMDCSGYTQTVYLAAVGKLLPRSSTEQAKTGTPVDFKNLKFGDLVFFNTTGDTDSHVGIYLGDDLFAHASVTLGVTISSLQSTYYSKRYECARRIVEQP